MLFPFAICIVVTRGLQSMALSISRYLPIVMSRRSTVSGAASLVNCLYFPPSRCLANCCAPPAVSNLQFIALCICHFTVCHARALDSHLFAFPLLQFFTSRLTQIPTLGESIGDISSWLFDLNQSSAQNKALSGTRRRNENSTICYIQQAQKFKINLRLIGSPDVKYDKISEREFSICVAAEISVSIKR